MNVKLVVYDKSKYEKDSKKCAETEYRNIKSYEVSEKEDNEIYDLGFDEVDEYKEYLKITLENGEEATFRNSHVDMFKY